METNARGVPPSSSKTGRVAQHILAAILSLLLMMPPEGSWGETAAPGPAPSTAGTQTQAEPSATTFNPEQLDALLAPVALYPDDLLMQTLMAATYPLQIVEAARWLQSDNNKDLKGDALANALEPLPWDPSVKSLVPFPQVLEQLDQHLDWTQQVGYAMATQQADVLDSVQRLRAQAQQAGHLKTTEQQVVSTQNAVDDQGQPTPGQTIVIQPADPQVVYVPAYNPSVVYGSWPYPAYPPVYYPPPAYYPGAALATGVAFAAGVAVVGSLWGWAGASWGYGGGSVNVNTARYNNITRNNVNRGNFNGNNWRASSARAGGRSARAPGGPVKAPARLQGLPANAVGRPNVSVPRGAVNRPNIGTGARTGQNRPGGAQGGIANGNRPGGGNIGAGTRPGQNRPAAGQGGTRAGNANRANAGAGRQGLQQRPATQRGASNRGAFGGMNDGARAAQFQQRGSQSRAMQSRGGGGRGGGARGGGGGARRGGGGGGGRRR
jgi:hypothetical protein